MTAGLALAHSSRDLKPAFFMPYLDTLNPFQKEAVLTTQGPLLVLAGAGTGKTRVLTVRIAHILDQHLAFPSQILAVTFTNKAASEMRDRIAQLLQRPIDGMWVGTFHSIAVRILRRHAELIGLRSNFTILDTDDQIRLIKQLLNASPFNDDKIKPKDIALAISRLKDKGIKPDGASGLEDPIVVQIYQEYQERLKILNAADFGDLLLHNLTLFQEHPEILREYQNQFHYLLVDEYQDTNTTQYIWLRLLARASSNICCVGDDDQSIYGWRGAEVGNILRFEKDFPGAAVIRLEQNYRSTAPILKAASGLIAHNQGRYGKTLWTEQKDGDPVHIKAYYDGEDEARHVGIDIEDLQRNGQSLRSMAILVRASFQTRTFEEMFMKRNIPYRVVGGLRFYERQEIRDCLAYLRLVVQPDDALAFERVINLPRRGIGDTTLQRLHQFSRDQGISLPKAARFAAEQNIQSIPLQTKARAALLQFFKDLDRWQSTLSHTPHGDVVKTIFDESGYTGIWLQEKSNDAMARIENIKELVQAIEQFESIEGFLEHVSLVLDANNTNDEDMVTLMTLHGAKGLEFDTVFLTGWEEGLFPHPRSFAQDASGIEEERRLAYVGISRARKRAVISYAFRRRAPQGWQSATPSRFIFEIPQDVTLHFAAHGSPVSGALASHNYRHGAEDLFDDDFMNQDPDDPRHTQRKQQAYPYRHSNQPRYQPHRYRTVPKDTLSDVTHRYRIGDHVYHEKFGEGDVIAFEGDKILVDFKTVGVRKIMAAFLNHT